MRTLQLSPARALAVARVVVAGMLSSISLSMLWNGPALAQTAAGTTAPRVTPQTTPTKELIQAIHAVNDRVLWASGHGGVVLRTTDGGATWQARPTPAGDSIEFRDVHALNADTAWILSIGNGATSRIYRTNDGGASWQMQFQNHDSTAFYDCLTFLDTKIGLAFSDVSNDRTLILRTDNAGASWNLLPASAVPAPLPREGAFASSGQCVIAADSKHAFIATGSPGARLFRSNDAGKTWSAENTPFVKGSAAGITGLAFKDALHGIAVGANIGRLRNDTSTAVVGLTSDGGRTWRMRTRPGLPGALSGIAWVPGVSGEAAVAVGFGGSFYTLDAGQSWTTLNDQIFTGVAAIGKTAWIAGSGGKIVRLDWP